MPDPWRDVTLLRVTLLAVGCLGCPAGETDADSAASADDDTTSADDDDSYPGHECVGGNDDPGRDSVDIEQAAAMIVGGGGDFGCGLAGGGDADGDGQLELLVGAPYQGDGRIYRMEAPFEGVVSAGGAEDVFCGSDSGIGLWYEAGRSVAWMPGGDGGRDRVLVSNDPEGIVGDARERDDGDVSACYLATGTETGFLEDVAIPVLHGGVFDEIDGTTGSNLYRVASGDLDGGGGADLVVGAASRATVWVLLAPLAAQPYLGDAHAVFTGAGWFGDALATGNLDGDDADELLVGAPRYGSERGACYVIDDPSPGVQDDDEVAAILTGESTEDRAGSAVAVAGDVDGDGVGDALVGAPDAGAGRSGRVYLVRGPLLGEIPLSSATAVLHGESGPDLWAGTAVAGPGDVNGDGFADVLVGAPGTEAQSAFYLLLGPLAGAVDLADADLRIEAPGERYRLGATLDGAGDLDGDGRADVLVGAPGRTIDDGAGERGAVYVFHSTTLF